MQRIKKKKIINKHQQHKQDTGSPQVQIAIITERIGELTQHLETHPKDNHSRKGLLMMVGKRRRLLNYLKMNKREAYDKVVSDLKLRK